MEQQCYILSVKYCVFLLLVRISQVGWRVNPDLLYQGVGV